MEAQLYHLAILAIFLVAFFLIARRIDFLAPFVWIIQIVAGAAVCIMLLKLIWPIVFR